jgi:hypothetical protein
VRAIVGLLAPRPYVGAGGANVEVVRHVSINRGKCLVTLSYLPSRLSVRKAACISADPVGLLVKFHICGI